MKPNTIVPIGGVGYVPPRVEFDIPQRLTNASSRELLNLGQLWNSPQRSGADQHRQCASKGWR